MLITRFEGVRVGTAIGAFGGMRSVRFVAMMRHVAASDGCEVGRVCLE